MCLAVPAQVRELHDDDGPWADVDVLGVHRRVSLELLVADPPAVGDWVLIHVGFALSKVSEDDARSQLELLEQLGEASTARRELQGPAA